MATAHSPRAFDDDDDFAGSVEMHDKHDTKTRHNFITKVFGIVGAMLLFTFAFTAFVYNNKGMKAQIANPAFSLISMVLFMVVLCVAMCNPQLLRQFPQNMMIISFITLFQTIMFAGFCAQFPQDIVINGIGLGCALTFGLSLFAMQTTYDFSGMGPYLFVISFGICIGGFLMHMMGVQGDSSFHMVYSIGVIIFFGFCIIYDVQLISGGKHQKYRLSIDDYAAGALILYLDIINLIMHIMMLLANSRDRN